MKRKGSILILLIIITSTLSAQDTLLCKALSNKFLNHLIKFEYDTAYDMFDKTVKEKFAKEKLKEVWQGFNDKMGKLTDYSKISIAVKLPFTSVTTTLVWEKSSIDMKVSFNAEKKIVGFFFLPSEMKTISKIPGYANKEAFTETAIEVKTGMYVLPGLITKPKINDKVPLVILVHGSGPNDRNETIGPNQVFRDLAYGLSSNGIAVIRYDKRTKVYGSEMANLPNLTVADESIDDAVSAIKLAKTIPGIDTNKIFIIGHSLGGMLAPRIATQMPSLAGIIVMAGNSRKFEELLLEQYEYIFSLDGISKDDKEAISELKHQIETLHSKDFSLNTPKNKLPLGLPTSYWMDLNKYNQKEVAKKLAMPMLFLQGERDYQVTMVDFNGWKKALSTNKNASFISYPDLNHCFMTGKGKATPAEYEKPGNVSEEVIKNITECLKKH